MLKTGQVIRHHLGDVEEEEDGQIVRVEEDSGHTTLTGLLLGLGYTGVSRALNFAAEELDWSVVRGIPVSVLVL